MKDNWAAKFQGKRKLSPKDLAHARRDVAHLEAVKAYLTYSSLGIREKFRAKRGEERSRRWDIWDDWDFWDK